VCTSSSSIANGSSSLLDDQIKFYNNGYESINVVEIFNGFTGRLLYGDDGGKRRWKKKEEEKEMEKEKEVLKVLKELLGKKLTAKPNELFGVKKLFKLVKKADEKMKKKKVKVSGCDDKELGGDEGQALEDDPSVSSYLFSMFYVCMLELQKMGYIKPSIISWSRLSGITDSASRGWKSKLCVQKRGHWENEWMMMEERGLQLIKKQQRKSRGGNQKRL
jgi:hypothetical protein